MHASRIPLYRVVWLDHWATVGEEGLKDYTLTSIGFLGEQNKNYIQLAQTLDPDGEPHAPYINIAKKLIVSKKCLSQKKKKKNNSCTT